MHLENWIYFDEKEEKQKLIDIMSNNDDVKANLKIQKEFNMNVIEANKVIKTYHKNIEKNG